MNMIAKEMRDRITADVSGDLSPAESEQLLYELLQLPEARQFHQALQRDRDAIQSLHRLSPGSELSTRVLAALAKQAPIIRIAQTRSAKKSARWPQFVGLALGLALAFGTAWLISENTRPAVVDSTNPDNRRVVLAPKEQKDRKPVDDPDRNNDEVVIVDPDTSKPAPPPTPREKPEAKPASDVLTAPKLPQAKPVEVVKPRMSLPMVVGDFATDSGRDTFKTELLRDSDHRIELFSHDTARLAEELLRLSKSKSHPIVSEAIAGEAIKRKVKAGYAVYLESCTADEIMGHVRALARESRFETLVLTPIADGDRRELRLLLGRDPLDSSLETAPKSDSKRTPNDTIAPGGYLSIFPPPKLAGQTKDQINYLDRRPDRSPGKLRLYLILRPL